MSSRVRRKAKFMSIFFSDKSRELRNIIGETVIIAVAISGLSLAEMAIVSVQRLLLLRSLARQKEEKTFGTSTPPPYHGLLLFHQQCFSNLWIYPKKHLYKLAQRLQLTLGTSSQQCPDKHLPAFRRAFGVFIATAATCYTDYRCSLAVGRAVVLAPTPVMPSPVRVELNI